MIVYSRKTNHGLFKVKQLDNNFKIVFYSNRVRGCRSGRKLFSSLAEAKTYISLLLVTGFTLGDL